MMNIIARKSLISKINSSFIFKSFSSTSSNETSTVSGFLLHKYSKFSPVLKNPERSDLVLSYLKQFGFSDTQLERAVKWMPKLLSADLDKIIKPKIKILRDFGFSAGEIAVIISKGPSLLHRSASNRIIPTLSVLKGLLGSIDEVSKALRLSGSYWLFDLEKTLLPNVEFLKSCGIGKDQIIKHIYFFPRFFLHKPELMKTYVDKADKMGVDRSSGMFIYAARVASSMTNQTLELKFKTFRDLGFSEDDILRTFRKAPFLFTVSEEKLKKVAEILVETGKYDMSCIAKHPNILFYSIENRYMPRIRVLTVLEKRNLINKWPTLASFHWLSDEKFYEKFVAPYINEVGEVYFGKRCD